MPVPVVLLAVCGCPGSGKTTLAKEMASKLGGCGYFYTISFDAIERQFYGEEEVWKRDVWKRSRLLAYRCIQTTLQCIQECNGDIHAIQRALSQNEETNQVQISTDVLQEEGENNECMHIVIADDTFHLRSMRRTLVRICQECHSGYAAVVIRCPLDVALLRNAQRPVKEKVPDASIQSIYAAFEIPNVHEKWEANTVFLSAAEGFDKERASILTLLKQAADHPLERKESLLPIPNTDSYNSFLHRLDLALRKEVGRFASQHRNAQSQMRNVSALKKEALRQARLISDEVTEENMNAVVNDLSRSFQAELAATSCVE